jgi:hypothetical protein
MVIATLFGVALAGTTVFFGSLAAMASRPIPSINDGSYGVPDFSCCPDEWDANDEVCAGDMVEG